MLNLRSHPTTPKNMINNTRFDDITHGLMNLLAM